MCTLTHTVFQAHQVCFSVILPWIVQKNHIQTCNYSATTYKISIYRDKA